MSEENYHWYKTRLLRPKKKVWLDKEPPPADDWCGDIDCHSCEDGMACCGWWQHWSIVLDLVLCNTVHDVDVDEYEIRKVTRYIREQMGMKLTKDEEIDSYEET